MAAGSIYKLLYLANFLTDGLLSGMVNTECSKLTTRNNIVLNFFCQRQAKIFLYDLPWYVYGYNYTLIYNLKRYTHYCINEEVLI